MSEKKEAIRQLILAEMAEQLAVLAKAVAVAADATTHADAKSEGKYDTRAIESGYLAGAQASRLQELKNKQTYLTQLVFKTFTADDEVDVTALVFTKERVYFLLPGLGGFEVEYEGRRVVTVAPESKLGRELIGAFIDDSVNGHKIAAIE